MNHRPRKRFGQNFLQDQWVIDQIISACHIKFADQVVEIGPGKGALTKWLLPKLQKLTAIEIDTDLQEYLLKTFAVSGNLELINADALQVDYQQLGQQLRIIGNLPYNISTPLLLHLLDFTNNIEDMHFMLQQEVVKRLAANPGSKDYGRLTVMVQYYCQVEYLFDVLPEAFYPQPKVNSAIVRLIPYQTSPFPPVSRNALTKVVAKSFAMRRKTIANNLKTVIGREQLIEAGIDPALRPEQIAIIDYVRLTNFIANDVKL